MVVGDPAKASSHEGEARSRVRDEAVCPVTPGIIPADTGTRRSARAWPGPADRVTDPEGCGALHRPRRGLLRRGQARAPARVRARQRYHRLAPDGDRPRGI